MSGGAPPVDQMAKVEEVHIIRQVAGWNNGLQYTSPLWRLYKTHVGQLLVHPFLPTQSSTWSKLEENGHREWSTLADDKIGDWRSQWSPRYISIAATKGKPHMARQWWRVITGNFWEMGKGIIPRVYKRNALTIRIAPCFLLIGMAQFRNRWPLCLRLAHQEHRRQPFFLYGGKNLGLSLASWCSGWSE